MERHRFDPISAVLGIVAGVGGLGVALDVGHGQRIDLSWWVVAFAVLLALAIVPWSSLHHGGHATDLVSTEPTLGTTPHIDVSRDNA
jgi:heme/copper-type cytochrome/quinol oxidase subunit 2